MNIAFVSYEYPPETGGGGIGTYLHQSANLLRNAGHLATIFAATGNDTEFWENDFVFRIPAKTWKDFNEKLPNYFLPIHKEKEFDIIEGIDFNGCGLYLKRRIPELPLVVKLHTPLYMVDKLLHQPITFLQKLRFIGGALKQLKFPKLPTEPTHHTYEDEFKIVEVADRISSPGKSIFNKMNSLGFKVSGKTDIVPLPISVQEDILNIEPRKDVKSNPRIVFIGRLEKRKGVLDLAKAIPLILNAYPQAFFSFVGRASLSPEAGVDMISYLKTYLKNYQRQVEFTGEIPHQQVARYLKTGDIFVFPSHYESFGIACCEAMAAGKAVIGSAEGGMAEILNNGECGLLVKPKSPREIAELTIQLIENSSLRLGLGLKARQRILSYYSPEVIIPMQIENYTKAIKSASR